MTYSCEVLIVVVYDCNSLPPKLLHDCDPGSIESGLGRIGPEEVRETAPER